MAVKTEKVINDTVTRCLFRTFNITYFSKCWNSSTAGYVLTQKINDAFPSKCPHCDWLLWAVSWSSVVGTVWFSWCLQVLSDALMRQMSHTNTWFLSDSRQNAAKLSAGIKRDHCILIRIRQIAWSCVKRIKYLRKLGLNGWLQSYLACKST